MCIPADLKIGDGEAGLADVVLLRPGRLLRPGTSVEHT